MLMMTGGYPWNTIVTFDRIVQGFGRTDPICGNLRKKKECNYHTKPPKTPGCTHLFQELRSTFVMHRVSQSDSKYFAFEKFLVFFSLKVKTNTMNGFLEKRAFQFLYHIHCQHPTITVGNYRYRFGF
jgi:hypothetical protein